MQYRVLSIKTICVFLILYSLYSILNTAVLAVTMNSTSFSIQSANVEDAAGTKSSTNYTLSDTVGQLAAGQFSSIGYIIKAGFQYMHTLFPFRFSISKIMINFGDMTPDVPKTDYTLLTVSFNGSGQYQVTAAELGKMAMLSGATIPDTTCDAGACTKYAATPWTLSSTYGFGYNMTGQDIPADFVNNTYYRGFANRNISENPAVIMSSPTVGRNRQSTLTFKLNVNGAQAAGTYQTVINLVATPSY